MHTTTIHTWIVGVFPMLTQEKEDKNKNKRVYSLMAKLSLCFQR